MAAQAKDPKRVAAGKRSRKKGRKWEWEIIHRLRTIYGPDLYRGQQGIQGGAAPGEGCDVEGTPFFIEAKHEGTFNWRAALQQAEAKAAERDDSRPVLIIGKEDKKPPGWVVGKPNTPPVAVMRYDAFCDLIQAHKRLVDELALLHKKQQHGCTDMECAACDAQ